MLIVQNGFELHTAQPTSHEYHFQAVPSPVVRGVTAPFDPRSNPPVMINDMSEPILMVTPTAADCVSTSFSFRLQNDPQTVHSLSSARNPNYGNAYMPTVDGNFQTRSTYSYVPFRYGIYTGSNSGHINSDGSVYYTAPQVYIYMIVDRGYGDEFIEDVVRMLNWAHDILLVPQSVSQQEYLYTVSGS